MVWLLAALAILAVLPYLRSLSLPFISDDYVQIKLARDYGPVSSWGDLARDPLYRCRATSLVLTYWTDRLFGLVPLAYFLSSLMVHVLNTWLVLALGLWRPVGWRIAAVAAAFFAVYEGHQEAVIWYAALPELLVFFFGLLSFLFWFLWVQAPDSRKSYAASLICFVLALYSKESGVAVAALLLLPVIAARVPWQRWLGPWLAFVGLAAVYTAMVFAGSAQHLHFHDGTFSLGGQVALVLFNSTGRLLWFWGAASLLVLAIWRPREHRLLLVLAAAWVVLTFLPYSFIAYMPRVPSRHTYFASAGLALVISAAAWTLRQRLAGRPWILWALAGVMVAHNSVYVWTRKHHQFAERAEPTEALVRFAEKTPEPIYLHCFPFGVDAGQWAVEMRLGKKVIPLGAQPVSRSQVFCLSPERHRF